MIRLLDFALLTFLVWFVWSEVLRGWRQASARPAHPADTGGQAPGTAGARPRGAAAGDSAAAMTLVRCDSCSVHVPSARALPGAGGRVFCSETCRARSETAPR